MPSEIESNGTTGTANLLTANVQMTGQSSSSSDYDYFKLYNSGAGTSQFNVIISMKRIFLMNHIYLSATIATLIFKKYQVWGLV